MVTRSIYITVRVDIECPDNYDGSDMDLLEDLEFNPPSLPEWHECETIDFEVCGINE